MFFASQQILHSLKTSLWHSHLLSGRENVDWSDRDSQYYFVLLFFSPPLSFLYGEETEVGTEEKMLKVY